MNQRSVERMSEEGAKEALLELIAILDEADEDDTFGTEGWRHRYGYED